MSEGECQSFLFQFKKYGVNIVWSKAHIVFLLCWKTLRKVLKEGIYDVYNIGKVSRDFCFRKPVLRTRRRKTEQKLKIFKEFKDIKIL